MQTGNISTAILNEVDNAKPIIIHDFEVIKKLKAKRKEIKKDAERRLKKEDPKHKMIISNSSN